MVSLIDLFSGRRTETMANFLDLVEEPFHPEKQKKNEEREKERGVPGRGLDALEKDKKGGRKNSLRELFKS